LIVPQLAAVVFEEDWGAEVVPQLTGRRLIAPALLPFELAQVCSTVCGLLAENVSPPKGGTPNRVNAMA